MNAGSKIPVGKTLKGKNMTAEQETELHVLEHFTPPQQWALVRLAATAFTHAAGAIAKHSPPAP